MTLQEIQEIDPSESILFLGAGFSKSAENICGDNIPLSDQLQQKLANMLNVDGDKYDLKVLADEVHSRPDFDLYQILYETFTANKISKEQDNILRPTWKRIYTTNYDDIVEFFHLQNNNRIQSYSFTDDIPQRLNNGSIIHLHGVIRSTNRENMFDQLVLNESSYVRQRFEDSPWYNHFIRDLKFCQNCFFVGYGLRDYHISSLLMQNENWRQKIFFVVEQNPDEIFKNRVSPYGKILPIGLMGFSQLCQTRPRSRIAQSLNTLNTFRYLDPIKDKKTLSKPTVSEIMNLVAYGGFNDQRCYSTLPLADYVIPRKQLVQQAVRKLKENNCLLVHSRLGNGKSIFLHILAYELSQDGFYCFLCKSEPELAKIQQDIEFLNTLDKAVIFFDSYDLAVDLMENLKNSQTLIKLVVTVRTNIQDVRMFEIIKMFPEPRSQLSLDGMNKRDKEDFKNLLDKSGIRIENFERTIDRCRDFRDVVSSLYNNSKIAKQVTDQLAPAIQDKKFRSVFVVSHLFKSIGQDVDAVFLRNVTNSDPYIEIAKDPFIAYDIYKLDEDRIEVRSAVFSEYLIKTQFEAADIMEFVYRIITEAIKRKTEHGISRTNNAIIGGFMRYSALNRALGNESNKVDILNTLFERLRLNEAVNREPLFWLQYAILKNANDELPIAEHFIETAYSRAANIRNFHTFQIDTFALGLLMRIESRQKSHRSVKRFDQIIEKLERVRQMIGDGTRRYHAIKVLEGIDPFIQACVPALSTGQKNIFIYHFNLLIDSLNELTEEDRKQTGVPRIITGIKRANQRILTFTS